ncbi:unnamed protein product, partial [Cyprideis torosa]
RIPFFAISAKFPLVKDVPDVPLELGPATGAVGTEAAAAALTVALAFLFFCALVHSKPIFKSDCSPTDATSGAGGITDPAATSETGGMTEAAATSGAGGMTLPIYSSYCPMIEGSSKIYLMVLGFDIVFSKRGNLEFGLILETSSDENDCDDSDRVKRGMARVMWYPSGMKEVIPENELKIADRTLKHGDEVCLNIARSKQRGICRRIHVVGDFRIFGSNDVREDVLDTSYYLIDLRLKSLVRCFAGKDFLEANDFVEALDWDNGSKVIIDNDAAAHLGDITERNNWPSRKKDGNVVPPTSSATVDSNLLLLQFMREMKEQQQKEKEQQQQMMEQQNEMMQKEREQQKEMMQNEREQQMEIMRKMMEIIFIPNHPRQQVDPH